MVSRVADVKIHQFWTEKWMEVLPTEKKRKLGEQKIKVLNHKGQKCI
jgi:hypothetical protein